MGVRLLERPLAVLGEIDGHAVTTEPERDAGERGEAVPPRAKEEKDELEAVERFSELRPKAGRARERRLEAKCHERDDASNRDAEDPRRRQAEAHVLISDDDDQRRDDGRRREDGVLERAEAEDARARVAVRHSRPLERLAVERGTPALEEDAEAGSDERSDPGNVELGAALGAGHLPVGERVADVGGGLRGQWDAEPEPV